MYVVCLHPRSTPASFFFFNDPPTTQIYTLSLHDALPISQPRLPRAAHLAQHDVARVTLQFFVREGQDRKSTRLNSSHVEISYAVFCLKKKTDNEVMITVVVPGVISSNYSPSNLPSLLSCY